VTGGVAREVCDEGKGDGEWVFELTRALAALVATCLVGAPAALTAMTLVVVVDADAVPGPVDEVTTKPGKDMPL